MSNYHSPKKLFGLTSFYFVCLTEFQGLMMMYSYCFFTLKRRSLEPRTILSKFLSINVICSMVYPCWAASLRIVDWQVMVGRLGCRLPDGFHVNACLVISEGSFPSVWPIQPHLRLPTSSTIRTCPIAV